jgi:hypothetical protein
MGISLMKVSLGGSIYKKKISRTLSDGPKLAV